MDRLTGFLKEHQAGEWCKRAAWIIMAIGLIELILTVYNLISQIQMASTSSSPSNWQPSIVYGLLFPLFSTIAQLIFFFFVLYIAGIFLNHIAASAEANSQKGQEELLAEREYLQPGQFRKR